MAPEILLLTLVCVGYVGGYGLALAFYLTASTEMLKKYDTDLSLFCAFNMFAGMAFYVGLFIISGEYVLTKLRGVVRGRIEAREQQEQNLEKAFDRLNGGRLNGSSK